MTPDEIDRLIHRYFEGALSPAEERQLWHLLRTEPEAADRFVELSELESALVESLHAEEVVPPEVRYPGRSSRRQTRVLPTAPSTRRTIWPLFLAAGLMLGFVALLIQSASKPEPVEMVRRPEPPVAPPKPEPKPPVVRPEVAPQPPTAPLRVPTPVVPGPKPLIVPKPVDPTPEPKPEIKPEVVPTVVASEKKPVEARIDRIDGDVVDDAGALAKVGPLTSGLEVRGAKASAVVLLLDGTRVELRPGTKLEKVILTADQKRFVLSRGVAVTSIAKQPEKVSVVFQTPHAEVTVIGTTLTVEIGKDATRVEVQEGRVRCRRLPDGPSVEIAAGRFAVAGKGVPLTARPTPVVRAFQDGPDYQGTRDTWISFGEPTQNFATGNLLRLRKLSGALTTLISWDISSIPPGSRIVSADLTWWVTGKLVGPVQVYHLRVPFEESEATWKAPGGGKSWFIQGAQSDGDRGTNPIATLEPAKPGFSTTAMNEAGIRSLQEWINAKTTTYGILVAGPEANEWNLDSRESAVPDRRPKLTITYIPPTK